MSLRITISSWPSVSKTVMASLGFLPMHEKTSSYIFATRLGVSFKPSRLGSSPMASRISRTAFSIRVLSNRPVPFNHLGGRGLGLQSHLGRDFGRGRRSRIGRRRRILGLGLGPDFLARHNVIHV